MNSLHLTIVKVPGMFFYDAITEAKRNLKHGACVDRLELRDYWKMECLLSTDCKSGFCIRNDGMIVCLFSSIAGRGDMLVEAAKRRGGYMLECFEGKLSALYAAHGFSESSRSSWDDEYAPKGWNVESDGKPAYLAMTCRSSGN
jgi:hypothetical protein